MIEGDVVADPGDLGSLTVSQATVTGAVRARSGAEGANASLQVRLVRSVAGAVDLAGTVPIVTVSDSVLDAAAGAGAQRAAAPRPRSRPRRSAAPSA